MKVDKLRLVKQFEITTQGETAKVEKPVEQPPAGEAVQVSLSQQAPGYTEETPEAHEARVRDIEARVRDGTYLNSVPSTEVAKKMILDLNIQ